MGMPLTPERLVYELVSAGDPRISPDGRSILYSLSRVDPKTRKPDSQLWICDIDGGSERQITRAGSANGGARWSPDGGAIAFVSDRVKKAGIFVMPACGAGEARELTAHNQGISDLAWSPSGDRIAYVTSFDPSNPDEEVPAEGVAPKVRVSRRIDYKQDGRGYLGDARSHVFVVDVASGARTRITTDARDHWFPDWSPDGDWLAFSVDSHNGMCSTLRLFQVSTGESRTIGPELGNIANFGWSPSGDRIAFAGDTTQTFQSDLFVYSLGDGVTRRLTDDLQCLPVGGAPGNAPQPSMVWLDDRQVLFSAVRAGASGLYTFDSESGGLEPIVAWQALHAGLSIDDAKRHIVQARTSFDDVGNIVVYDVESGTTRAITHFNDALLAGSPPAKWERFDVQRGEFTIKAWLLTPPAFDPAQRYPVVLDIHGGPNGFYGYGFTPVQQLLATNGFLVVFSNPRGSSSYGRHFTQQVSRDWGGEDYLDLMAVVDTVLERPYADAGRTGAFGYSYGGYMTSWIIGQTPRFQACVCGAPCFDLESMYGTSDISHQFGELQWGGAPDGARDWYLTHSPATYAHRATTPTLIVHGEADERCPIGQAEQMFVALTKAGCEVEFARYPGGSHSFPRTGPPEHRADYLTRVLGWFQEHLM